MKKHYDFSKAKRGALHRPLKSLRVPIYLDEDVQRDLIDMKKGTKEDLSKVVNAILRSQIGVVELLK